MGKDFTSFLQKSEETIEFQQIAVKPSTPSLSFSSAPHTKATSTRPLKFQEGQLVAQSFLSLLTAPLVTTHVSLQLSVFPSKSSLVDSVQQDLNALSKASQNISIQDRRKYELLIRANATGKIKPFRAPAYGGYMDTFRGLSNQGLLGFYKGNLMGLFYSVLNSQLRFTSMELLDRSKLPFYQDGNAFTRGLAVFGMCSIVDMICQPIQTIQSRFILQNRLPNFSVYKSLLDVAKKHRSNPLEFFRGSLGHAVKNAIMGFTWTLYDKENPQKSYIISTAAGHLFSYPIFTVIRRIQCQSVLPGMLSTNYQGTLRGLKTILVEEGVRGLYRGFIAYAIANSFLNAIVILSSSSLNAPVED